MFRPGVPMGVAPTSPYPGSFKIIEPTTTKLSHLSNGRGFFRLLHMATIETGKSRLGAWLSTIPFPLILAANLAVMLYLAVDLKDYDAKKKELVDKSALLQEAAVLRAEIATLKSQKDELDAIRKEVASNQAKLADAKATIAKADAASLNLEGLHAEEAALNARLNEGRKAITSLIESRSKFVEAEKAADQRIAKASSATEELTQTQAKLSKALAELQKTQNSIDELNKTKAQLDAVKAELALKAPELAAIRDEIKLQTKTKTDVAGEIAILEKKKFDLRLLEDARSELLRLLGERTTLNADIALLAGQKDASLKELDRLAKNLGTTQGQLRVLLAQKTDLEAELIALRAATIKK